MIGTLQELKSHAAFRIRRTIGMHAWIPSIRVSRNFARHSATAMTCVRYEQNRAAAATMAV